VKVTVIGTGYVGLVSAACLASFGHDVTGLDVDEEKIAVLAAGKVPLYEPGLEPLLAAGRDAGRIRFSAGYAEAVPGAAAVLLAVGTPQRRNGMADLAQVDAAAASLATHLDDGAVVAVKSTVPVGTTRRLAALIAAARGDRPVPVASNPEFLRQGSAVDDFLHPDRIVVGADDDTARETLRELYAPQVDAGVPLLVTGIESAELIKYAANAFLAMKLSFVNEIADLCEAAGASIDDVAAGMGLDRRISGRFLAPGPGFGGSCLPKDAQALLHTTNLYGTPSRLLRAAIDVNETRKRLMADRIAAAVGGSPVGRTVAVLGITFKANTDDLRESPALEIVRLLLGRGATVRIHDPEGMGNAAALLPGVPFAPDPYAAVTGADAVAILTEWPQFAALDLQRVAALMAGDTVLDLRNVLDPARVAAAGLRYRAIGRPDLNPPGG